jgi:hypothetical protein
MVIFQTLFISLHLAFLFFLSFLFSCPFTMTSSSTVDAAIHTENLKQQTKFIFASNPSVTINVLALQRKTLYYLFERSSIAEISMPYVTNLPIEQFAVFCSGRLMSGVTPDTGSAFLDICACISGPVMLYFLQVGTGFPVAIILRPDSSSHVGLWCCRDTKWYKCLKLKVNSQIVKKRKIETLHIPYYGKMNVTRYKNAVKNNEITWLMLL